MEKNRLFQVSLLIISFTVLFCGCFSSENLPSYLDGYQSHGTDSRMEDGHLRASNAAYEWFRDAKFGMFVHWGIYSVKEKHEWEMEVGGYTIEEYEKLAPQFNPTEFDAAEWVSLVKEAGIKYITITSKHHDGFAMWDSDVSDWDIIDRTPYKKDVLKMLSDECARQGIGLAFYHSHIDWHHQDFYPRGGTGRKAGRPESGDFDKYIDYMNTQVEELCKDYGPISGFWFDGEWDLKNANWRLQETYDLIHKYQPHAMICNNAFKTPRPGEDYQVFERSLPGHSTYKANTQEVSDFPLESADTMNRHWGYNKADTDFKTVRQLVHYLVRASGIGGNLLLNVGPPPTGKLQPEVVERLKEMGKWTTKYGESIYATRGGPMAEQVWGVMTQSKDGEKCFIHVLEETPGRVVKVPLKGDIKSIKLFDTGKDVPFNIEDYISIDMNGIEMHEIDTILVMEKCGELVGAQILDTSGAAGSITLKASDAKLVGSNIQFEKDKDCVGYWVERDEYPSWQFKLERPGKFKISIDQACMNSDAGNEYIVVIGDKELHGKVAATGSWTNFKTVELAEVTLAKAGVVDVKVKVMKQKQGSALMNLRSVIIEPAD